MRFRDDGKALTRHGARMRLVLVPHTGTSASTHVSGFKASGGPGGSSLSLLKLAWKPKKDLRRLMMSTRCPYNRGFIGFHGRG